MAGKVTTKGQVTIPLAVRERLGIHPGSFVDFELVGETAVMRKRRDGGGRGAAMVAKLRGRATTRLSTDEIMALTRGE